MMAIILALPNLFDTVVAAFGAAGSTVDQAFGWSAPNQQYPSGTRIVWTPGDPNGSLGEFLTAREPGRNPRPLATLGELFTVQIRSSDETAPNDERAQYQSARLLFDSWWSAVYTVSHGRVRIVDAGWLADRTVRRHGAAIQVVCSIEAMIPEDALAAEVAAANASLTLNELDQSETVVTA